MDGLIELGSRPPSTEPKTPKPQKVPKKSQKVSREEFETPRPWTPKKFQKKSEKSRKEFILTIFGLFRLFSELFRGWGRGIASSSRETFFETFGGFGVLGSVPGEIPMKE